jgi:hypothetical protein
LKSVVLPPFSRKAGGMARRRYPVRDAQRQRLSRTHKDASRQLARAISQKKKEMKPET